MAKLGLTEGVGVLSCKKAEPPSTSTKATLQLQGIAFFGLACWRMNSSCMWGVFDIAQSLRPACPALAVSARHVDACPSHGFMAPSNVATLRSSLLRVLVQSAGNLTVTCSAGSAKSRSTWGGVCDMWPPL